MALIVLHLFHHLVGVQALVHQGADFVHNHGHFRTGGHGVNDVNSGVGIFFPIGVGGLNGGVVAAGESLGDGHGEDALVALKSIQPVGHVGAGGAALALEMLQVVNHLGYVLAAVVDVLLLPQDFQGDTLVPLGTLKQVGSGIGYNFIIHTVSLGKT